MCDLGAHNAVICKREGALQIWVAPGGLTAQTADDNRMSGRESGACPAASFPLHAGDNETTQMRDERGIDLRGVLPTELLLAADHASPTPPPRTGGGSCDEFVLIGRNELAALRMWPRGHLALTTRAWQHVKSLKA